MGTRSIRIRSSLPLESPTRVRPLHLCLHSFVLHRAQLVPFSARTLPPDHSLVLRSNPSPGRARPRPASLAPSWSSSLSMVLLPPSTGSRALAWLQLSFTLSRTSWRLRPRCTRSGASRRSNLASGPLLSSSPSSLASRFVHLSTIHALLPTLSLVRHLHCHRRFIALHAHPSRAPPWPLSWYPKRNR